MATWYPRAVRKPISRNHGGPRRSTRGIIQHVDAGGAESLQGWFNNPAASASSHFYVKYTGVVEQYLDADLIAWTQRDGNATCIGIETQGKGDGAWTQAQFDALVALNRWLCDRYGIPKQSMGNSKPSSRGLGYHRMGIDPWRVSGGEVWGPRGKVCPGDLRVNQFNALVSAVARGSAPAPAPAPPKAPAINEEDEMYVVLNEKNNAAVVVSGGRTAPVVGWDMYVRLTQTLPSVKVSDAQFAALVQNFPGGAA